MFNILVVEDEKNVRNLIEKYLAKNKYNVLGAEDGEKALEVMENNHIDLIITDVMMPNIDGYELTKELREANYNMPVLMITAKDTIEDKIEGFRVGTDDYMVKPIDMKEMILRVAALLRRSNIANEKKLIVGDVVLDYDSLSVRKGENEYILKPKEFYILYKLLSYPNKIFTRQDIMEEFWEINTESDPRTIDTHIRRIREKLSDITEFDIETVRGLGYKGVLK